MALRRPSNYTFTSLLRQTTRPIATTHTRLVRPICSKHASDPHPTAHFGFSQVPLQEKQSLVTSVFSSVASSYDIMNDLMSLRLHRVWKDAFVNQMSPSPSMQILDVAAGTADISIRIAHAIHRAGGWANSGSLTVSDINDDMLSVARNRLSSPQIPFSVHPLTFVVADAQQLPFEDNSFDLYSISFGMRNVPQPQLALQEAFRVLRPGGRFLMLEFAAVDNPFVSTAYDAWSFNVIPLMGRFVANEHAYRYLVESIRRFPKQEEFLSMLQQSGFVLAQATDYTFGVATCYSAFKP